MADASSSTAAEQLSPLETAILGTVETLDRLHEFAQAQPDHAALAVNL